MSKQSTTGRIPGRPRRRQLPLAVGVVAALAIAMIALSLRGRNTTANPDNPQQVALGRQVYAQQCASCHGERLEGQPNWQAELPTGGRLAPPHDASGHTWHHPDRVLFDIVKRGGQASSPATYQNNMPAFGGTLSDAQIWAALAYIKSSWPPEIRAAQAQVSQQAR